MRSQMPAFSCPICAPDADRAEPRGAGAVARSHHLFRLALSAIGDAPEGPVLGAGDGGAAVPELGGDAAVAGVFQHADALAVADLPPDFASELKVVTLVVDGPAPVGLHVDAVVRAEDFFERLRARLQP